MTDSRMNAAWRPAAVCAAVLGFSGAVAPVAAAWALSADIEARPQVISANSATELVWSSGEAKWCYGTGSWSGGKALQGSVDTGRLPAGKHWYGIVCSDNKSKVRDGITVVVRESEAQALAVELAAEQQVIRPGTSASLRWSSTGAELCRARGTWDGTRALQGTFSTGPLAAGKYWYGMLCRQGDADVRDGITIVVRDGAGGGDSGGGGISVTLDASPQQIRSGESSSLSWSSEGATSCEASGDWGGSRARNGSWGTGSLTETRTYRLTCTNGDQTAMSSVSVQVGEVPVVNWQAPTRNEDGSSLDNLAGYWLYYGRNSRDYTGRVRIWSESRTQYRLDELDSGDYYISLTAINSAGEESDYSNEIEVTVP